jgi:hypothetical protein
MSRPGEPFDGSDFDEDCPDCLAPAGALCYDDCISGYSSATREQHVRSIDRNRTQPQPEQRDT